jgi:hypothetical protein
MEADVCRHTGTCNSEQRNRAEMKDVAKLIRLRSREDMEVSIDQ